jgi:hypothetical protein
MIAIGGMKGVLDEAQLFADLPGRPVFALATTGGAAALLPTRRRYQYRLRVMDVEAEGLVRKCWEHQEEHGARKRFAEGGQSEILRAILLRCSADHRAYSGEFRRAITVNRTMRQMPGILDGFQIFNRKMARRPDAANRFDRRGVAHFLGRKARPQDSQTRQLVATSKHRELFRSLLEDA